MKTKSGKPGTGSLKPSDHAAGTARRICEMGREFHARGWMLGTSGNMSAVVSREPLRWLVTASGLDKGRLQPDDILEVGSGMSPPGISGRKPSDESLLHREIILRWGAGAVLHTHSIWSTILSERYAERGGFAIEGYEMLKGLDGVKTHRHREWVPIIDNDQDMANLTTAVFAALDACPGTHAFLLRRHGLYTWGKNLSAAKRHVEIMEFLLEAIGRGGDYGDDSNL